LTYLERQKLYGPDKKILFKKQLFDLKVKVPQKSLRYATDRFMVMHSHTNIIDLSRKKQLFDFEVKGQGPTKVITVCNTHPYGHAPTYQISLTYLEKQKCYGTNKKILFKNQFFDLEVKCQGPTKVTTVCDTPPYGHVPT
jgi:hypothetical protein